MAIRKRKPVATQPVWKNGSTFFRFTVEIEVAGQEDDERTVVQMADGLQNRILTAIPAFLGDRKITSVSVEGEAE